MRSRSVSDAPQVRRLPANPIIRPDMDDSMGRNVNGPSLIRVPTWVERPLGNYYLYFAHHQGSYIRMAYADAIDGPWSVFPPGVLHCSDTVFEEHIASPDVHLVSELKEIRMYFHGCCMQQMSRLFKTSPFKSAVR